jgi:hypothetical protein
MTVLITGVGGVGAARNVLRRKEKHRYQSCISIRPHAGFTHSAIERMFSASFLASPATTCPIALL